MPICGILIDRVKGPCGDVEKLIRKYKDPLENSVYFVTIEETFDFIQRAHISTGHGGCDRMVKSLFPKYANITTWATETFKSFCLECQRKKKRPVATGVVVQPIITSEFNNRGQVDLIDMQSTWRPTKIDFSVPGPPNQILRLEGTYIQVCLSACGYLPFDRCFNDLAIR